MSEPTLEQLKVIHSICPISFLQSEYSLLERGVEQNGILDFCRIHNITFVAYSPLCRGLLTNGFNPKILEKNDYRLNLPRFTSENYDINLGIINKLENFASNLGASLSALSLAWLIAQNVVAIPGMRKSNRVTDALTAINLKLSPEDLKTLNDIAFIGSMKGMRYTTSVMETYGFK